MSEVNIEALYLGSGLLPLILGQFEDRWYKINTWVNSRQTVPYSSPINTWRSNAIPTIPVYFYIKKTNWPTGVTYMSSILHLSIFLWLQCRWSDFITVVLVKSFFFIFMDVNVCMLSRGNAKKTPHRYIINKTQKYSWSKCLWTL